MPLYPNQGRCQEFDGELCYCSGAIWYQVQQYHARWVRNAIYPMCRQSYLTVPPLPLSHSRTISLTPDRHHRHAYERPASRRQSHPNGPGTTGTPRQAGSPGRSRRPGHLHAVQARAICQRHGIARRWRHGHQSAVSVEDRRGIKLDGFVYEGNLPTISGM